MNLGIYKFLQSDVLNAGYALRRMFSCYQLVKMENTVIYYIKSLITNTIRAEHCFYEVSYYIS